MIIVRTRFNIYLLSVVACVLVCGCRTKGHKEKAILATLRVHLEVIPDSMDFSTTIPIFREKPVMVTVDKAPFLTEANVAGAKMVEVVGGYSLEIQFNRQGSWLLESYTTTHPGKHFAIFSAFVDKDKKKWARWLGAPIQTRRISNGKLTFTPDATRSETEQIALGLNNVAKKNKEDSKW